ncbi:sensor histidine kinase [Actinomadura opuntiae]|uniref:sensor histidine kinase n=1 Tax=Actinomadura sp. OS1-43 TaxID=604315 RepID=UPI00255B04DE|nr:nitrate- and nitrite sensing domain-containing protein [Actinomadura sp. OS1-43]MDL4819182.1 nitrate- and nitrite sensing domain-containing protein [Actinomadura sp. OS1-43]
MRTARTRPIRSKVAALLLVPLVSLVAIWVYAADITGRAALAQRKYHTLNEQFAASGQGLLVELGKERQASVVFLSGPRRAASTPASLTGQRARLDKAVAAFRRSSTSDAARGATTAEMRSRVSDVLRALGGLGELRAAVDARRIDRLTAVNDYSSMVDVMHRLYDSLIVIDDSSLYNWTLSDRAAGRAMELLQRENALVAGALVTHGRMTAAEHRMFLEMLGEQRWQWQRQRSLADPKTYARLTAPVFASTQYHAYKDIEDQIAAHDRGPLPISAWQWQETAQPLVLSVNKMIMDNTNGAAERADGLGRDAYLRLGVVGGAGLLVIALSVLLVLRFGRGVVRELVGLRGSAEELADERLPRLVERLRRNEPVDVEAEAPALPRGRTTEVARLAESFAKVQRTAVDAAVGQAELRAGVSRIFLNIARRNQSLLHRQLTMLDGLESRAEADDLEALFRIDHLTTRMRRHAESLIILSGATPGRGWRRPVHITDVLRAAVAEIEDYPRVAVLTESEDGLVGSAVTDVVHLLAELLENAASFSPPNTEVRVMAERVGTGFVVEVEDRGLGVKPEALAEINRRLAEPPEFDLVDTDQLGLFVVARLAARHGIDVTLHRSPYGGVTAIVLMPHDLVVPADRMGDDLPLDGESGAPAVEAGADAGEPAAPDPEAPDAEPADEPAGAEPAGAGPTFMGTPYADTPFGGTPRPEVVTRAEVVPDIGVFARRDPGRAGPARPSGAWSEPVPLREAPPVLPQLAGPVNPWGSPEDTDPGGPPGGRRGASANPWSDDAADGVPAHREDEPSAADGWEPAPVYASGVRTPNAPVGTPPDDARPDETLRDGAPPHEAPPTGAERHGARPADDSAVNGDPGSGTVVGGERPRGAEHGHPAGTHAGLPRRVRQENLAPQLRKEPPPPPSVGGGAAGGVARSPEEARSLMASVQQGWRRGRASDGEDEGTR